LRPVLGQLLDLPGRTVSNEHQSKWLLTCGAVLLADLAHTCSDVLHINNNILAASRNEQNLLGAWWFSCYYSTAIQAHRQHTSNYTYDIADLLKAFNSSLAIMGILLIKRMPAFSTELSDISAVDLRAMLDTAMDVLHGLDKGSKTIMRCRDTLTRLLAELDSDSAQGTQFAIVIALV